MSYGIICNARAGHGIKKLALVDRTKSKIRWWISDCAAIAIEYKSKAAAEFACSRLNRNNPKVVPFADVRRIMQEQDEIRREIDRQLDHEAGCEAMEEGWDGHKCWSES